LKGGLLVRAEYALIIAMTLLFIGINLAANNSLHSFIIHYLFYKDKMSSSILRLLGVAMLVSVVFLIMNLGTYTLLINTFVAMIFVFFSIKGRAKAAAKRRRILVEKKKAYDEEILRTKKHLEEVKQIRAKVVNASDTKGKPKSVKEIKEELWDDGTMTNKEMIEKLK
jgi:hypothetical protein